MVNDAISFGMRLFWKVKVECDHKCIYLGKTSKIFFVFGRIENIYWEKLLKLNGEYWR
jgi:hypothetical protein